MIADVRAPSVDPPPPTRPREAPPFEEVLATHEAEIYRYLRRLAPTPDEAADLHQETFLRAFRAYGRLETGANVRAWLYRIAGNLARDAYRRRTVRRAHGPEVPIDPDEAADASPPVLQAPSAADPHVRVEAALLRDAVRDGLLGLTGRQRVAVIGRVLEGRDYGEVAAALGCSETTARQHVSQGLARLRAMLGDWMEVDR